MKGLFINSKKAKDSIYESGFMVYQSLLNSRTYHIDYCEVDADLREIKTGYDFYFFNYHPVTMGWLDTSILKKQLGFVITMILEVAPSDAFVLCPKNDFDLYCALDPTIRQKNNLYPLPRPLEQITFDIQNNFTNKIPVIGSFGFATRGKGFQHVVDAVNKEFDSAIIRINIPFGDFVPDSEVYANFLGNLCKQKAKKGIEVQVTHDFMTKEELIKWCAANTLNCFLYDRNMPGLSATTDQAIVSGRPLAVSDNDTFRHITAYLPPYPRFSLKESIEKSVPLVKKMKDNWQPQRFKEKFETILSEHETLIVKKKNISNGNFILPLKKYSIKNIIQQRIKKYSRKLKNLDIKKIFRKKDELI
ncbi:MAG TPA: hypothetical protein PKC39_13440 [Ferruginibacter sp.]|nr:hypothetical protein [Ferruginibacter sp.]HMP21958.1 hypothetical protein [Ferruginibacter sp.]